MTTHKQSDGAIGQVLYVARDQRCRREPKPQCLYSSNVVR
jgi:hypothetical protein